MLLGEAFEYWRTVEPRKHGTSRRYGGSIARLARAGLVSVEDVTKERVVDLQRSMLARGMRASSVRAEFTSLRGVLAQLVAHGLLEENRLTEIRRVAVRGGKTTRRRRVRFLTREELEALAASAARVVPRLELPVRVAVLSGCRIGELARLRAEDYREGMLHVMNLPEFGEAGSCKTGERTVPVCAELAQLLRERLPQSGWLFPSGGLRGPKPKMPFLSRDMLESGIRRARRAAGLPDDITATILRHTRASWWLIGDPATGVKGASIYKCADWLGHSVSVCEAHYGSLLDVYDPECESMPALITKPKIVTAAALPA